MVMDCLIFSQHRSSQVWKRVPFNNGEERRGTWGQMLSLSLSLSLSLACSCVPRLRRWRNLPTFHVINLSPE